MKQKSTSILINPDTWVEARVKALKEGISVSQLVEDALQKRIKQN